MFIWLPEHNVKKRDVMLEKIKTSYLVLAGKSIMRAV